MGATSHKTKGMVWYKFQGVEYSLLINGIIKNHKGRENIRINRKCIIFECHDLTVI